jgi:hypothetical protein
MDELNILGIFLGLLLGQIIIVVADTLMEVLDSNEEHQGDGGGSV